MRALSKFDIIRLRYDVLLIIALSPIIPRTGCNNKTHDILTDMQVVCNYA